MRDHASRIVVGQLAVLLAAGCGLQRSPEVDRSPSEPSSPFVRVEWTDGRAWFKHGQETFLSIGVNAIIDLARDHTKNGEPYPGGYDGTTRFGGDMEAWADEVSSRLKAWHFNTLGGWSNEHLYRNTSLYRTHVLWLGNWGEGEDMRLVDVWDDAYREGIETAAAQQATPHAQDERLIGFFINNELPWYGERAWPTSHDVSLVSRYMAPCRPPRRASRSSLNSWRIITKTLTRSTGTG